MWARFGSFEKFALSSWNLLSPPEFADGQVLDLSRNRCKAPMAELSSVHYAFPASLSFLSVVIKCSAALHIILASVFSYSELPRQSMMELWRKFFELSFDSDVLYFLCATKMQFKLHTALNGLYLIESIFDHFPQFDSLLKALKV